MRKPSDIKKVGSNYEERAAKYKFQLDLSDPERAYGIAYYHGRWNLKPVGYNKDLLRKSEAAHSAWLNGLLEGISDREAIMEYAKTK